MHKLILATVGAVILLVSIFTIRPLSAAPISNPATGSQTAAGTVSDGSAASVLINNSNNGAQALPAADKEATTVAGPPPATEGESVNRVTNTATRTATRTPTRTPTRTATRTATSVPTNTPLGATATPTPCSAQAFNGSLSTSDATQAGRLLRDYKPSTCAAPKAMPGISSATPRHYDAYTFSNPREARCV